MILNAYSIYDRKALQYHPPFYASTDGAAARSFSEVANDLNTSIGRHPADFVLYCVGTFADDKATLTPLSPLRHVIDAEATISIKSQTDLFKPADLTQAFSYDEDKQEGFRKRSNGGNV